MCTKYVINVTCSLAEHCVYVNTKYVQVIGSSLHACTLQTTLETGKKAVLKKKVVYVFRVI